MIQSNNVDDVLHPICHPSMRTERLGVVNAVMSPDPPPPPPGLHRRHTARRRRASPSLINGESSEIHHILCVNSNLKSTVSALTPIIKPTNKPTKQYRYKNTAYFKSSFIPTGRCFVMGCQSLAPILGKLIHSRLYPRSK